MVEVDSIAVPMLLIVDSRPFLFANNAFKVLIFSQAPLSPDSGDIVPEKGYLIFVIVEDVIRGVSFCA